MRGEGDGCGGGAGEEVSAVELGHYLPPRGCGCFGRFLLGLLDDVGDHDRFAAGFLAGVGGFHEGVDFDRFFARNGRLAGFEELAHRGDGRFVACVLGCAWITFLVPNAVKE